MEAHAASRYERDMQAMKDWPEYTQLLDMTRKMLKCVTKPPTAHGTIIALGALGDFATMLETITPPQGLASRGSRHAAILISEVLQQCLAEADLENAPAVAQDYLADKEKTKHGRLWDHTSVLLGLMLSLSLRMMTSPGTAVMSSFTCPVSRSLPHNSPIRLRF